MLAAIRFTFLSFLFFPTVVDAIATEKLAITCGEPLKCIFSE